MQISVVIPVKDEERGIQSLINALKGQTFLPFEVIFVDGGSTDNTRDIIKRNMPLKEFSLRLVEKERAYPGEGRNEGVKEAKGDIIAFIDGGIIPDKDWLKELAAPVLKDNSVCIVYGAYEPVIDSFIKECSNMAFVPPRTMTGGKTIRTDFIASSLFKKEVVEEAGYFPPFRAAEDKIFMENAAKLSLKTVYAPDAVVKWEIPSSIAGIYRRFTLFSFHDIIAGRMKDWHFSVMRTYALMFALYALGNFVDPFFFLGIALVWLVRIAKAFVSRKYDFKLKYLVNPAYFLTIILIVFVTDIAMFSGCIKYIKYLYAGK